MLKKFWNLLPVSLRYVLGWFFATRLVLTIIGLAARALFVRGAFPWVYSRYPWLAIWGVWDSGWYLRIAQYGYSATASNFSATLGQAGYAFFPLYPWLMRLAAAIIGNYFIAGLVISNLCLIVGGWYLYRLAALESSEATARRAVKYLFVFPVAFIFSGVFSEALFLVLAVGCLYYARKQQWAAAAVLGFLAALSRLMGVILIVPLVWEFYRQYRGNPRAWIQRGWALFGPPLGLLAFGIYVFRLTGNFFSFLSIQAAWHRQLANPLRLIYGAVLARDPYNLFAAAFAIACLALLVYFYRRINLGYWLFAVLVIALPMFSGLDSLPRYTLAAFPLFLLFAKISEREIFDDWLAASLLLLQGLFMAIWTIGLNFIK